MAEACAIAACLRGAHYDVRTAAHFGPALVILDKEPIDLLLANIAMPGGVNGFAMTRLALLRQPEIKVIYVTGYDLSKLREEAAGPILWKPIEDEVLLAEISRVLALASPL